MQRGATALGSFLRAQGVPDTEVLRGGVQTEPVTYTVTDDAGSSSERGAYKISRRFTVQSSGVGRVQALAQNIGTLIGSGIPVSAEPVQYLYTRLADVRLKLLADATRDARERAQAIAEASGSRNGSGMGAVRSARMEVFQITPHNIVQHCSGRRLRQFRHRQLRERRDGGGRDLRGALSSACASSALDLRFRCARTRRWGQTAGPRASR